MKLRSILIACVSLLMFAASAHAAPKNFGQAKVEYKKYVYFDRNDKGDFYCGCNWEWKGKTGGTFDIKSCGYKVRAQPNRVRLEAEHVVPASYLGHQMQCWQQGGRKNCNATSPEFNEMEASLYNIVPSFGEINADRSDFRYATIPGEANQYGACQAKTDFKGRKFEPRDEVKGEVARISFYMYDRYGLSMSKQQQQLFSAWDRMYPVTEWEAERNRRIAKRMGHVNPFVTGERKWGDGKGGKGQRNTSNRSIPATTLKPEGYGYQSSPVQSSIHSNDANTQIRGNKNSNVYHLASGCPSYTKVSERNRVNFASEREAIAAGYRKAGNCR